MRKIMIGLMILIFGLVLLVGCGVTPNTIGGWSFPSSGNLSEGNDWMIGIDFRQVEEENWDAFPAAVNASLGQIVTGISGTTYKLEKQTIPGAVTDYVWVPVKEDGKIKTVDCRNVVEEDWSSLPPAKDVFLGQTVTGVSGQEYKLELSTNSVCDYAWVSVKD